MEKIKKKTLNNVRVNIEQLKKIFPMCVTDGKINFENLKRILGEEVTDSKERYQFNWVGKNETIKGAQTSSSGTLLFCEEESVDFDETNNIYVEGDNLESLKILQKSYFGKIKIIYIDPPYNTGKDFIYKDNFQSSINNYKRMSLKTKQSNPNTSGRFHTDWLNMMYSRLMLSRNFLMDEGVIFISIDETELFNLKKICDEIFGEKNFIGQYNWFKSATPPNLSKKIKKNIDYILCYEKNIDNIKYTGVQKYSSSYDPITKPNNTMKKLVFPRGIFECNIGTKVIEKGIYGTKKYPNKLLNKLEVENKTNVNEIIFENRFIWRQEKLDYEIKNGTKFKLSKDLVISYKKADYSPEVPPNLIDDTVDVTTNESENKSIVKLFKHMEEFDFPKPISLIKYLLQFKNNKDALVLDFFSGSASTAHAVMQLNAEDGGDRKYIMVQLPEVLDEKSEAYKEGYRTIPDIAKERIRRAGKKIKEETNADIDYGFKVFKLDTSNIKEWDPSHKLSEDDLFNLESTIKSDRSDLDVVYEIMLKLGIELTVPIEEKDINGKTLYNIGMDYLYVFLDKDITIDDVKELVKGEPKKVVFLDSGFKNDNVKFNAEEILKNNGVESIRSI